MKINHPSLTLPQMNADVRERDKALEKIATAQQLRMEDAAARSIASQLQSQVSGSAQGLMNINDGISMMQIADGALQSLSDQTQTLNDLSVRYNSASLNQSQKQMLQTQFNDTLDAMAHTVKTTSYNGQALLGSSMSFSIGEGMVNANISNVTPQNISIDDPDSIERYQDRISSALSDVGSATNTFVSSGNSLLAQISSTAAAKSQIADTDMAQSTQNYQQYNLGLNAAQLTLAHQNNLMAQNIARLLG